MANSEIQRDDPSEGKSGVSPSAAGVSAPSDIALDPERRARIAQRAYELAERRCFAPGGELEDWLQAEREIEAGPTRDTPPPDLPFH